MAEQEHFPGQEPILPPSEMVPGQGQTTRRKVTLVIYDFDIPPGKEGRKIVKELPTEPPPVPTQQTH